LLLQAMVISLALHGLLLWSFPAMKSRVNSREMPLEVSLLAPAQPAAATPVVKPKSSGHPQSKPIATKTHTTATAPQGTSQTSNAPPSSAEELRAATLLQARGETSSGINERLRSIAPHDRNLVFGAYEEAYRRKVENVGSVNYPPPMNGRPLSGAVRMRAVVGADGQLIEVTVENSSGVRELDQAARRIVEMAQPFQAFTSAMKAEADRVSMVCTFRFTSATNGVSSLP
jgi:protein TonB